MAESKIVNAIVLRAVNYRDFDRMLTLFSREEGKISAGARGAHRQKSALSAASTQFCTGEYVLDEKNGKYSVKNCMLDEAYYPLREDAKRFAYAAALTQVCEEIVQAIRDEGITLCHYGHVHGKGIAHAVRGWADGVEYRLISADAVGFSPVLVSLP